MERQECWYLYGDQYGAFSMWEGILLFKDVRIYFFIKFDIKVFML